MRGISQSIIFTTGHGAEDEDNMDWAALARTGQPIVIYMGLRKLDAIAQSLMLADSSLIHRLPSSPRRRSQTRQVVVSTLASIASDARIAQLETPAIIVIGDIVRTRQALLDAASIRTPLHLIAR